MVEKMEKKNSIKEIIKDIPNLPGIYKMLDSNGTIIYIGKSKNLRNRVNSYFTRNHTFDKINTMVSLINSIEYVVTDTHLEERMLVASSDFRFETAAYYRELIKILTYISLVLDGYKDLYNKKIIAKIPTLNGYKLFFIHKGTILIKKDYKRLSNHFLNSFIKKCNVTTFPYEMNSDEKVVKDYISIIYSELLSLPKDNLIFLDTL